MPKYKVQFTQEVIYKVVVDAEDSGVAVIMARFGEFDNNQLSKVDESSFEQPDFVELIDEKEYLEQLASNAKEENTMWLIVLDYTDSKVRICPYNPETWDHSPDNVTDKDGNFLLHTNTSYLITKNLVIESVSPFEKDDNYEEKRK